MRNLDFIGSQAFNIIDHADGGAGAAVHAQTGALLARLPLLELMGIREGIGLRLALDFRLGMRSPYGLPDNWHLGLPFVADDGAGGMALYIGNARHIAGGAHDKACGLRYVHARGITFADMPELLPLPHGGAGAYHFRYAGRDGSAAWFDAAGRVLLQADRYGNRLAYSYGADGALESIRDSFGQLTTLRHGPGLLQIAAPDGRTVTLAHAQAGVSGVTDHMGRTTRFTHVQQHAFSLIASIARPTGLLTTVAYTSLPYLDADGATHMLPAVSELVHADGDGTQLAHHRHVYGRHTLGASFTGHAGGHALSAVSDGLADSRDPQYEYDVQLQMLDREGTLLYQKEVFYNAAHLPVLENTRLLDAAGSAGCAQVRTCYDSRLQPLETWHGFDAGDGGAPRGRLLERCAHDEHGNLTDRQVFTYAADGTTPVAQLRETTSHFTDAAGICTLAHRVTRIDAVTGQGIQTVNALAPDRRDVAMSVIFASTDGGATWEPWKSLDKEYDKAGRVTGEDYQWQTLGYSGVAGSWKGWAYDYDPAAFTLTVSATDALGHRAATVLSTMFAATVAQIQASGKTTHFIRDALGRLVETRSPSGAGTRHAYRSWQADGENSVAVSDALGYTRTAIHDALGRLVRRADSGNGLDGGQPRILGTLAYDALGRLAAGTDRYGRRTTSTWNSLGMRVARVDPFGKLTTWTHDLAVGAVTTAVNGVATGKTVSDGLQRIVLEQAFADPAFAGADAAGLSTERQYTGFGRLKTKRVSRLDAGRATPLCTEDYVYDCDQRLTATAFSGADGTTRTVARVLDLNGHEISRVKAVSYEDGGHYAHSGDVHAYDAAGRCRSSVNGLGQTQAYAWDADGKLTGKTLFDGSAIAYAYNDDGRKSGETWRKDAASRAIAFRYDAAGRRVAVEDPAGTLAIAYSADGIPVEIRYPDGRAVHTTLDRYSRCVEAADTAGATLRCSWTDSNRLATLSDGFDTYTCSYAGAAVSVTLEGRFTATRLHDAHGRAVRTVVTLADGQLLLQEDLRYDVFGQLAAATLASECLDAPAFNATRTFAHDSLHQLSDTTLADRHGTVLQRSAFLYDGNGKLLKKTVDGAATLYEYNALGQLSRTSGPWGLPAAPAPGRVARCHACCDGP